MVLIAVILRVIHGSWLAPSALYSLWWAITTLVSLLVGSNEVLPAVGLVWLLISCSIVGIGSLVFIPPRLGTYSTQSNDYTALYKYSYFLRVIYFFSTFVSFSYIISFLLYNEVSINDLKSFEGLLTLAVKFSKDRYEENVILPLYIKLQLPFVFFSNALGGALFAIWQEKKYLYCLIPPVLIALLFTEKAGIFFCLSAWLASLLSVTVFLKKFKIFNYESVVKLFVSAVILLLILVISAFARLGAVDMGEFEVVVEKLYSTLFGHIAAFSNWLASFDFFTFTMEGGRYTFSGVFDFFGISKRESGIYTDNYQMSNGAMTNLYTIHKGLLLDFSVIGSLIVYFVFGVIGSFFFLGAVKGKQRYVGFLSIIYLIIFVSIFYSIFIFNTTLLSCIMTVLVFFRLKLNRTC